MQNRRITKPDFRPCSTDQSRSQAPFCLCAHRPIANRAEGTLGLLRYHLGGDRPSQTAQIARSPARVHGSELGLKHVQGGVSSSAPQVPEYPVYSLPPTLRRAGLSPMLSCSKGSRGLSVWLRVGCIFTTTTVSPSRSWRQWSGRYAIHAGRNLPDKELRYLRTVIVTAAVYRSFGWELHGLPR